MINRKFTRIAVLLLITLIIVSVGSAVAATNTVPASRLDEVTSAVNANTLKPTSCSAINLTRIVVCTGGNCDGTNANELLLGTSAAERIRGRGGTDCIVGGGGDDQLVGNGASDVCIGGPGTDTFTTCETQIQ
jgi:Ca2+-binding RTX toxin-like protein